MIDADLFEILQNDVFHYESQGKILIISDFNGRVSIKGTTLCAIDHVIVADTFASG